MTIDDLIKIPVLNREIYETNGDKKPNNHCYWDDEFGCWTENDEHYRERILDVVNQK